MSKLNDRLSIIYEIAKRKSGLGKTAMMKYLYILQTVYNVPLGYNFGLYTYGPFATEVLDDLDYADANKIIIMETAETAVGAGYSIQPSQGYEDNEGFTNKYNKQLDKMLGIFEDDCAKDLELSATIIYMYRNAKRNGWRTDEDNIVSDVYDVKPYFKKEVIKDEFERLNESGVFHSL